MMERDIILVVVQYRLDALGKIIIKNVFNLTILEVE